MFQRQTTGTPAANARHIQLMDKSAALREAQLQRLEATLATGQPKQSHKKPMPETGGQIERADSKRNQD